MRWDAHIWLMAKQVKKRGRPPVGGVPMTQIAIRVTDDQLERIERIREARKGVPDRAAIIREAIEHGLDAMDE